jgi:chromate transporter
VILAAAAWGFHRAAPSGTAAPALHWRGAGRTAIFWSALWLAPLTLLSAFGPPFLAQVGWLFALLAVVTFGGAYAVLAYLAQVITQDYGWLSMAQMIDALGLAETTPGPLILVTQFAAMLAGQLQSGPGLALAAGAVALWATFVPCFLWIFIAGPMLDQITARPRLNGALSAITAAVVGVIASLSLWFAVHVLFAEVTQGAWLAMPLPDPASLEPRAALLLALAAGLMLGLRTGLAASLALLAVAGIALGWLWP